MPPEQRQKALAVLTLVPVELRKSILDQWAARLVQNLMRNPFGYLLGMIEKARNGEFNAIAGVNPARMASTVATPTSPARQSTPPESKPHNPSDRTRAVASKEMASIMQMMSGRKTHAGADNAKSTNSG
ncbi:hypothetical protein [Pseudomonas sp. NA-150]|uniref:hypothetical protein n=1 Tax=Pseudomonas sp. NA-150 TaxID=3367525 RepID=UPI0037CC7B5A